MDHSKLLNLDAITAPDPFEGLHTAYLQEKYFSEHFGYKVSVVYRATLIIRSCGFDRIL